MAPFKPPTLRTTRSAKRCDFGKSSLIVFYEVIAHSGVGVPTCIRSRQAAVRQVLLRLMTVTSIARMARIKEQRPLHKLEPRLTDNGKSIQRKCLLNWTAVEHDSVCSSAPNVQFCAPARELGTAAFHMSNQKHLSRLACRLPWRASILISAESAFTESDQSYRLE